MNDNNGNKKVILIKGNKSRWFEQAIFILKDSNESKNIPKNFVEEAEKIINDYMMKKYSQNGITSLYQSNKYQQNKNKSGYTPLTTPKIEVNKNNLKKRRKNDKILNVLIVLSCILIGLILYYFVQI